MSFFYRDVQIHSPFLILLSSNKVFNITYFYIGYSLIFFLNDSIRSLFSQALGNLYFLSSYQGLQSYLRGVAQLGSAGALGALGRRFESCRPDQPETGFPACLF